MQADKLGGRRVWRRGRPFRRFLPWRLPGNFPNDLRGSRFAYSAIAIVNAALRQREIAAAGAALGIKFVKSGLLLLWRETGKIYARELAGAVGVREKNLARVFKRFHVRINRQAEQGADFRFVESRIAQAF